MAREISIHSDGTGTGTTILGDDGVPLANVLNATVYMEGNERNRVTLEVQSVSMNTQADVTEIWFICPCCKETTTHICDSAFKAHHTGQCPDVLALNDPATLHQCIRGSGHTGKHFDGEHAWNTL